MVQEGRLRRRVGTVLHRQVPGARTMHDLGQQFIAGPAAAEGGADRRQIRRFAVREPAQAVIDGAPVRVGEPVGSAGPAGRQAAVVQEDLGQLRHMVRDGEGPLFRRCAIRTDVEHGEPQAGHAGDEALHPRGQAARDMRPRALAEEADVGGPGRVHPARGGIGAQHPTILRAAVRAWRRTASSASTRARSTTRFR